MKFRKNPRLKSYNYRSNGSYFITNNTDYSKPYLANAVKNIVKNELLDLANRFSGLTVYYYSLMPSHIHTVLTLNNCTKPIPEIWRMFKSKSTIEVKRNGFVGKYLWQRNYYEHVIRSEQALHQIILYIRNNPFREELPLEEIYGDRIPKLETE